MIIACTVTAAQLRELRALLRRRTTPGGHARRARVIVLTAEGRSGAEIASMELHVVLDNSSTHGTAKVKEWLANPRVHFHYTPTSASWLNQVEGFFGILGEQLLGVAHFPSKVALREHIDACIAHWNCTMCAFSSCSRVGE